MSDRYAWAGGEEFLHLWRGDGPASVIVALPPFEEANRLRAIMAATARALATRGITTAIPDLPGTGESPVATADARLSDWRAAFAAATAALPGPVFGIAIRAGALLDIDADLAGRWYWSPQGGAALARELSRLRQLGDGLIAGNAASDELLADLAAAEPTATGPLRTLRLATEAQPADRKLAVPPPWRRAEPDGNAALATLLADDIADWIATLSPPGTSAPPTVRAEPVEARAQSDAPPGARPSPGSGRTGDQRSLSRFDCAGETLFATLDPAPGITGLLIVSGGNEIRTGAHRGMATLARQVAAAGYPVFRYDRRGVGDSTGVNAGFEHSGPDLAAAAAAFRRLRPQLTRLVGFGNCDAATALALFGASAGIDALVLANPWTIEATEAAQDLPPPAAIRARYAAKLKDPRELWRLVSGGVDLRKLWHGLRRARATAPTGLADRLRAALPADATVLTARADNTAIAFRAALPTVAVVERDTDSHGFARPGDAEWLFAQVMAALDPPRSRGGGPLA